MGSEGKRTEQAARILVLNAKDGAHPQAGGAEEHVFQVGKRLAKNGFKLSFYCTRFPGAGAKEKYEEMEIFRVGNDITTFFLFPIWYHAVFRGRCDIIIDAERGIPFFSRLFVNKKIILLVHHYHGNVLLEELNFPLNYIAYFLEKYFMPLAYRGCDVVAVSQSTKDALVAIGFKPEKIRIIHNGIEKPKLPRIGKSKFPTVCYFGRLAGYKRIELLLKMFANARKKIPNAKLIVAGRGESAKYEKIAKELGLENAVEFASNLGEKDKYEVYARAWVFATCSRYEGWSLTVLEANSVGTPALGFFAPGLKDSIKSRINGELAKDEGEFAELLVKYLQKPPSDAEQKKIIRYSKGFTWEKCAMEWKGLIEESIGRQV